MSDVVSYDVEADPEADEFAGNGPQEGERVAVIRTSDRNAFRSCRRKWFFSSHLKSNLSPVTAANPLWYGSGFHYAMEDFHGDQRWPTARQAFIEYVKASRKAAKDDKRLLPPDFLELADLGTRMLDFYTNDWLAQRDPLKTFIYQGRPQVEVHVLLELPFKCPEYDRVFYGATLDRIVIDKNGGLWIVDYKTAKRFITNHFDNDPQITSYTWIGNQLYPGYKIEGFIYQQHRKDSPKEPDLLSNGRLSTRKGQLTTHQMYRRALINQYGEVLKAPIENIDYLNELANQGDLNQDHFIRRDFIYRNQHQIESEGAKLMMELEDILNPNLPLYPSPDRNCGHMCSFYHPCISMDDGSDWEYEIQIGYRSRNIDFDRWRKFLPPIES